VHSKNYKVKTVNIIIADEEQDTMQARALIQEEEASDSTVSSQQKKTRCCRKCGQPMKGQTNVHKSLLTTVLNQGQPFYVNSYC
jgi:hypothetical protein